MRKNVIYVWVLPCLSFQFLAKRKVACRKDSKRLCTVNHCVHIVLQQPKVREIHHVLAMLSRV